MLTAGWKHKETYSMVYFFRWSRSNIDSMLESRLVSEGEIPVSALLPSGTERLGELVGLNTPQVYLNPGSFEDMESDIVRVLNQEIPKPVVFCTNHREMARASLLNILALSIRCLSF